MSSYYNPATELTYELGADGIWRVEIGSGSAESLHYLGSITPPTDPATLIADPKDGDFYIYDSDGTAWNGEAVVAGYWVVFNPANGWQNVGVKITTGVEEVDVSGGVLTLAGTASKPVINLDKLDVQNALDDRYLEVDGSNTFTGGSLQMQNVGRDPTKINNGDGLDLCTGNVARLSVATDKVSVNENLDLNNAKQITFKGSSGNRLNMGASTWGALSDDGTPQLQWGYLGLKLREELNANGKKITNVPTPVDGGDAANMAYVDSKDYVLPKATADDLGGIKVGDTLSISLDGTLNVDATQFSLSPATASDLGGVKVGSGLSVTGDGTLSVDPNAGTFVKKSGDSMSGMLDLRNSYPLVVKTADGSSTLTEWYRFSNTEIRQNVKAGKTFKLIGYDNGAATMLMQVRSRASGDGNVSLVIRNLDSPVQQTDAVTLGYLEEELAKVAGAELATQTTAGTVKVNVTTSETAGIDAVYREGAGKLFVRKATTGTNNNSTSGTQRGVAAFHSDSFAASNGFITLKAATNAKMGGVKASSTSTDTSSAFVIQSDGVGKIRNNSNSVVGVQKKGQICTTSGSPTASDFSTGQMVMRTDTKAVYIKV